MKKEVTHLTQNAFGILYEQPSQKMAFILQFLENVKHTQNGREFDKAVLSDGSFKLDCFIHPNIVSQFTASVHQHDIIEVYLTKKLGQDLTLISEFKSIYPNMTKIVGNPIPYAFGITNKNGSNVIQELVKNAQAGRGHIAEVDHFVNRDRVDLHSEEEDDEGKYVDLSTVSHYDRAIKVKGRIMKKGDLRQFKTKDGKESALFNLVLFDGVVEIQGTFFGEGAQKYFPVIEVGKIYSFSDVDIRLGDKFNQTKFKYVLAFGRSCEVKKLKDNHKIEMNHFKFATIEEIQKKEDNEVVDVIGIVQEIGPISPVTLKTGESKDRRNITVYDDTKMSIQFALWGDLATHVNFNKNDIIVLQDVSIRSYQGKSLNFGFQSRLITNVPEHQRYRELVLFLTGNKDFTPTSLSTGSDNITTLHRIRQVVNECKLLDRDLEKRQYFNVLAHCCRMIGNLYYDACGTPGCNKKVEPEPNGRFKCHKCQKSFESPIAKFMTTIKIADDSGDLFIGVSGNENCLILFGKSVEELKQMKIANENLFNDYIADQFYEQYKFTITSKIDNYQNEEKIRYITYRVSFVENNLESYIKNFKTSLKIKAE